ncbi:hypothetical protein THASP1DRAFT_27676 [Thamnocephalis sphaerospora]|uniref:Uncharacterized protein n=1 Tax=Thamnocephalis sphaerospora TaxID=78915 RepID=A0A4P9XX13_9FUNG|nr:hypothetical protein THASP1DRAFT_27676 [Thamnocephalis sphaerospora]|eukprot:RKP10542.1 hypothetical protein THASP1DRAFT_27676 [Thamnocephalis sphaerospora]
MAELEHETVDVQEESCVIDLSASNTEAATDQFATAPTTYMSPVDHFFLLLERPGRQNTVLTLLWLDGELAMPTLVAQLALLCRQQPKFRQVAVDGDFWRTAQWVDVDAHRKLANPEAPIWHVKEQVEERYLEDIGDCDPEARDERERSALEKCVGEFSSQLLGRELPLWRVYVVRGISGRTVLGLYAHHCMADGIGFGLAVMSAMSPDGSAVEGYMRQMTRSKPKPQPAMKEHSLPDSSLPPAKQIHDDDDSQVSASSKPNLAAGAETAIHVDSAEGGTPSQQCPSTPASRKGLMSAVHFVGRMFSSLAAFLHAIWLTIVCLVEISLFRKHSFQSQHALPSRRQTSWSRAITLQQIKQVRTAYPGTTLNDVMIACIERAFSAYMDARAPSTNDPTRPSDVHAPDNAVLPPRRRDRKLDIMIPVATRRMGDMRFENLITFAYLLLPTTSEPRTTAEILGTVRAQTRKLKRSLVPYLIHFVLRSICSIAPGLVSKSLIMWYVKKCHAIATNVPGPAAPLFFGTDETQRHRVLDYIIYPPIANDGALALGIISYNGRVHFTAMADAADGFSDMARFLADHFNVAFDRMLADAQQVLAERTLIAD